MALNPEMSAKIQLHLIPKVNPYFIIVFGSVAQGQSRAGSDIDIAYLSDQDISGYDLFLIAQSLAAELNCDVDLVSLRKASTVFKAQVIGNGEVIYSVDENKLAEFRIRAFKEYALLNEERAEIMHMYAKRGRTHAG